MINIGQIESKTQYSLKRNDSMHKHSAANGSLLTGKYHYNLLDKSKRKPLQDGAPIPISFKGLSFAKKAIQSRIKFVPESLLKRVYKTLADVSPEQLSTYKKINENYIKFIAQNQKYRDKYGITDDIVKQLIEGKGEILIFQPKSSVASKFFKQLFSPFIAIFKWGQELVLPKNSPTLLKRKEETKILTDYRAFDGLLKSHIIWENGYRKLSGNSKLSENGKFLIPDDVIYSKLSRRRNKFVDPNKGKYSSNSLMIGNRLISGIVYSYFLGTDAYNTTMRYSNNKEEATAQRKSRISQEFSRIGLNMYIQNLLFGTFETAVNKSLPTAMFVSGSTVAFSEILGRKLVGKPIMPSNKEQLDKLEKEMSEKKGLLPSIGRLLTNVKKKDNKTTTNKKTYTQKLQTKNKANQALFKDFSAHKNDVPKQSQPSFKGRIPFNEMFKIETLIDKNTIREVYRAVKAVDKTFAGNIEDAVLKAAQKSEYMRKHGNSINSIEKILSNNDIDKVAMGKKTTFVGKLLESILVPVKFTKNLFISIGKLAKKTYRLITGKKDNLLLSELNELKTTTDKKQKRVYAKFLDFYNKRMQLEAWAKSPLPEEEKLLRIFGEFKSIKNKNKEDIAGIKNIILWIDKQLSKEGITIEKDGTLSPENAKRVREILMDSALKADGAKQLEYDGNTLAQTNINLSRAITTLFLVTDAYNLTMQYSNDNRKDATKSAKNRAAQELSRIGVSAYMMAFVHNLLAKLCNSSLGGAFTLTAMTSTINDSLSREVVGVPLTAKSQEELNKIDQKNGESKNPIKKALAYSIGKKSVLASLKKAEQTKQELNYFDSDFFITPQIKQD